MPGFVEKRAPASPRRRAAATATVFAFTALGIRVGGARGLGGLGVHGLGGLDVPALVVCARALSWAVKSGAQALVKAGVVAAVAYGSVFLGAV